MTRPLIALLPLIFLSACAPVPEDEDEAAAAVVGGTFEPDQNFPWVVQTNGCQGVLIHPRWVLTAGHCVAGSWSQRITYHRTDQVSGRVYSGSRSVSQGSVYLHPNYRGDTDTDIALIKLDAPFVIDPYIQTVAIPTTPRVDGTTGTLAGTSHVKDPLPPPGYATVLRATLSGGGPTSFIVRSPNASLCLHDSGSGLVTVEGNRATVRGIASSTFVVDKTCQTVSPNDEAMFVDVHAKLGWITQTMGMGAAQIAGNTRVRRSGTTARGVIGLACDDPALQQTQYAPLGVVGVELGANCTDAPVALCSLVAGQTSGGFLPRPLVIRSFTMQTTTNGVTTTTALPVGSETFAIYQASSPPPNATRVFTCDIGPKAIVVGPIGTYPIHPVVEAK